MILDILFGENDTFIDNSLFYFGKGSKRDRKIVVGKAPGNNKLGHKTYIAVYLGEYLPHLAETRI